VRRPDPQAAALRLHEQLDRAAQRALLLVEGDDDLVPAAARRAPAWTRW
jgi:hypothetical protein